MPEHQIKTLLTLFKNTEGTTFYPAGVKPFRCSITQKDLDEAFVPAGEHDDLVDSSTQALLRFRQGGFVALHSDEDDDFDPHARVANYY